MEVFLNRYRNLTVLLAAILAQLVLLAYQVKSSQDVRLIRVWAVSAVTPLARLIEGGRSGASHFFRDYFVLLDVRDENRRMKADLDRVEMENQYLRAELSTADRARSLAIFQQQSQSKTIAAHVIGNTTRVGAQVVIVDRGSSSKIEKGMAVITPEGIAGKVISVYPTASYVLLITDPAFAAGVISQKHHVRGTLEGQGYSTVTVKHVQNEETVEPGEWFYTSGDDRIFPKGLPVGEATVVRPGKAEKEIYVSPSGLQNGIEDLLIVIEGVHGQIPDAPTANQPVSLLPPPPADGTPDAPAQSGPLSTDADRLVDRYRKIGEAENHVFGERSNGAPNFNFDPNQVGAGSRSGDGKAIAPQPPGSPLPGNQSSNPRPPDPKPPASSGTPNR